VKQCTGTKIVIADVHKKKQQWGNHRTSAKKTIKGRKQCTERETKKGMKR
jgi:hypothetical protein